MAASSARLIVCRSGWDLMSMRVVVCVRGLTITAPSVGLPAFWDPSVYINASGFHVATKWRMGYLLLEYVYVGVFGYGYVYDWLISM